jgi:hypothetical protein
MAACQRVMPRLGQSEQRADVVRKRAVGERVTDDDAIEPGAVVHVFAKRDGAACLPSGRQEQSVEQGKAPLFHGRVGRIERRRIGSYDRKHPQPIARLRLSFMQRHQSLSGHGEHKLRQRLDRQDARPLD